MKTLITLLLSAMLTITLVMSPVAHATNKDKIHPYMVKKYSVQKAPVSKYKQQKIAKELQKDIAKGKKVCKNAVDRKTKQKVLICE
jgi:flagellar biosynthesis protein FliP